MDGNRFDDVARTLVAGLPRRRVLRGLAGSVLTALLTGRAVEVVAACQRKGVRCGGGFGGCCGTLKCCNKRCRNLKTDPDFCGSCTTDCPTGDVCGGRQ